MKNVCVVCDRKMNVKGKCRPDDNDDIATVAASLTADRRSPRKSIDTINFFFIFTSILRPEMRSEWFVHISPFIPNTARARFAPNTHNTYIAFTHNPRIHMPVRLCIQAHTYRCYDVAPVGKPFLFN